MIPEAMSAEEAADKAVLPSVLGQASWMQQLCDSSAVFQPPVLLPASILLKQEKKALAKLFSSFTASIAPFY